MRHGRRVRQEIVATLGRLDARGRHKAQKLAEWITGKRSQPSMFEPADLADDGSANIDLKKLRVERSRRFGDVFLGLILWRALDLDEVFDALLPEGHEDVRRSILASIHVILRLCSPSSDLALAEDVYRKTALSRVFGCFA